MADHPNSFDARGSLKVGDRELEIFRLDALQSKFDVARLPFSLKILLENLLRTEGNGSVEAPDIEALATWDAKADPSQEIAFTPAPATRESGNGILTSRDLGNVAIGASRASTEQEQLRIPRSARHRRCDARLLPPRGG